MIGTCKNLQVTENWGIRFWKIPVHKICYEENYNMSHIKKWKVDKNSKSDATRYHNSDYTIYFL